MCLYLWWNVLVEDALMIKLPAEMDCWRGIGKVDIYNSNFFVCIDSAQSS